MDLGCIILATASPRRHQLLEAAGLDFVVQVPEAVEVHWLEQPRETVIENARRKCTVVANENPGAIVIAADTVVAFKGATVGKPSTRDEARAILHAFSGHDQEVFTGLALAIPGKPMRTEAIRSTVHFKQLTSEQIEQYIELVDPLDKAGGYNIDQHGELIIAGYDGSHSNIMGLPVEALMRWLQEAGVGDGA
jgi:septum formation protein